MGSGLFLVVWCDVNISVLRIQLRKQTEQCCDSDVDRKTLIAVQAVQWHILAKNDLGYVT